VKIDLALRAPRARRQAGLEVLGDLRQLVGQGVEHPGRAVTGNRFLRTATCTGAPAGDIVANVARRAKDSMPGHLSLRLRSQRGDPMAEI
jgi:hypothetical protein